MKTTDAGNPPVPERLRVTQAAFLQDIYQRSVTLSPSVRARDGLSAAAQISVYRGSVYGNLTAALNDTFPVTRKLLGEKFFDAMALRYFRAHPPASPHLADLGQYFAAFVGDFPPLKDLPYIPDMVQLEWLWHCSFHAADAVNWDAASLALLMPERQVGVRFVLQPGLYRMRTSYALDTLWQAHQQVPMEDMKATLDLDVPQPLELLLYRSGFEVVMQRLSAQDSRLLQLLSTGTVLADLVLQLQQEFPSIEPGSLLGNAFSQQWIAGYN
jgi:hypothetical protein